MTAPFPDSADDTSDYLWARHHIPADGRTVLCTVTFVVRQPMQYPAPDGTGTAGNTPRHPCPVHRIPSRWLYNRASYGTSEVSRGTSEVSRLWQEQQASRETGWLVEPFPMLPADPLEPDAVALESAASGMTTQSPDDSA